MMNSALGHIKRILIHKYWVLYYCCKFGIIWRGIKHDLSKFHPKSMNMLHAMMNHIRYYGLSKFDLTKYKKYYEQQL